MNRMTTRRPGRQRWGHGGSHFWPVLVLMTLAPVCPGADLHRPRLPRVVLHRSNEASTTVATSLASARTPTEAHGFLLRKGMFTLIDAPDAPAFTLASSLNNRGDVVGHYSDTRTSATGFCSGMATSPRSTCPARLRHCPARYRRTRADRWLLPRKRRRLSRFPSGFARFPGHRVPGSRGHGRLWASTARTWIVGGYGDMSDGIHGFLLKKGIFSSIDFPGAVGCPSVRNQHPRSHRRRLERRPRMSGLLCKRIPSHPARVHKPRVSKRA